MVLTLFLSVVIPVYNESDKIEKTIAVIKEHLADRFPYEIVVVDDGSKDDTKAIAERISEIDSRVRVLSYGENRGKGFALKAGMTDAIGELVLFTDADLATPIDELDKFLPYFEQGYDVVIGSRRVEGANVIVHQPRYREFMGKVFNQIAKVLVTRKVDDFNCGFKCYKREVANRLYSRGRLERWGFDVEMFFMIEKFDYKVKEVPVRWINAETTQVHLIRDSIRSFTELIQIRINDIMGFYS